MEMFLCRNIHFFEIRAFFTTFSYLLIVLMSISFILTEALAKERSTLAIDVLVQPLDVTDYEKHKDHAQAVMNHFQRVCIHVFTHMLWFKYFFCLKSFRQVSFLFSLCSIPNYHNLRQWEMKSNWFEK